MEGHSTIRNGEADDAGGRRPGGSGGEVTALERGIRVMEAVVDGGPEAVSLGDVAARVGLPKSTVHRLLNTFVSLGYLDTSEGGSYRGSSRLLALAGRIVESIDYARLAGPALRELQEHTVHTIHFGILDGRKAVYVEKLPGRRPYAMTSRVGHTIPLHSSGIGKAVLAFLPPEERARLVGELKLDRWTDTTITSRRALEANLKDIHARWWALDDEENQKGIRCVGTPVFNHTGRVMGAISVSAPVFDFALDDATSLTPALRAAARKVSAALGAPPELFADDQATGR
jgi:IclR family acetate operon transcriptional repressor